VGVGVTVGPPLHDTPLSAKSVGAPFDPDHVPWNPNDVVAPAARSPFHAAFVAVATAPDCVTVELHACVTFWPDGQVQVSDQPRTACAGVSLTSAVNPPGHELVVHATWHAPAACAVTPTTTPAAATPTTATAARAARQRARVVEIRMGGVLSAGRRWRRPTSPACDGCPRRLVPGSVPSRAGSAEPPQTLHLTPEPAPVRS